jgi:hypothetical protein
MYENVEWLRIRDIIKLWKEQGFYESDSEVKPVLFSKTFMAMHKKEKEGANYYIDYISNVDQTI